MAKEVVGLDIDVQYKSVGNMKKELRSATNELIQMNEKFGASSKEATEAARRVAKLKDAIGDAKALADTFNPDKKFVALGGALQGAVSGFSALQGAMGLFGSESKDVEKMLLKVQSAMALQQGISGVANAMDAFGLLAGKIKTQVIVAFNSLRAAIGATGIGLLVVGLGLLVANFDKVKDAVMRLIPGLSSMSKFIGGLVTKITDFVGITSQAERTLEAMTKATKRTNEALDAQIAVYEALGNKEDEVYKLKKQRVENELNVLRESLKVKGKLSDEELEKFRQLKLQSQLLDIEERNRKKKIAEDEAKENKEKNDKIAAQNKEKNDKIRQQEREHREKLKKEEDDWNEYVNKTLEDQNQKEQKTRDDNQAEVDAADKREFDRFQKRIQTQLDYNQAVIKAEEDLSQAKFEAAQAGIGLLSTLVGKSKALSNTLFAIDKGLAIAKVVVDTQKEIAGYYANPTWKLLPDGGTSLATAAALKAKIRAGISIATIAATSISKYMNGGGSVSAGGGGMDTKAPMMPTLSPTVQTNVQNAQAINQMSNQSTRAYVLNSDIQNEQQRNAYLQRNASI